ncbi:MAG: sialidase family protein [Armatimonadota bacterium]
MLDKRLIFDDISGRPSSHCAVITHIPGGLACAWYAGSQEGATDVALMISRYAADCGEWSQPEVLLDTRGRGDGNAVPYYDPETGRLWLFHTVLQNGGWSSVYLYTRFSDDLGRTWSEPRLFDDEQGMMVRNTLVNLSNGRWVLPAYDEKTWESFCYLSDDRGETWVRGEMMPADTPLIQPTVVERPDGSLLAYMRTGGDERRIWASTSEDGGETWSRCEKTALKNPNSGIDMTKTVDGRLVLVFNNIEQGRSPLHVGMSEDMGETWPVIRPVESAPGEFSYPSVIAADDGLLHAVYTHRRQSIAHAVFDIGWLTADA